MLVPRKAGKIRRLPRITDLQKYYDEASLFRIPIDSPMYFESAFDLDR